MAEMDKATRYRLRAQRKLWDKEPTSRLSHDVVNPAHVEDCLANRQKWTVRGAEPKMAWAPNWALRKIEHRSHEAHNCKGPKSGKGQKWSQNRLRGPLEKVPLVEFSHFGSLPNTAPATFQNAAKGGPLPAIFHHGNEGGGSPARSKSLPSRQKPLQRLHSCSTPTVRGVLPPTCQS